MAGQTSKLLIAVSCALHFMLVSPSSAQTHEIAEDLLKSNLYDEAKQIWEKLAASGDHLAEKRLGDLYYLGTGLKRDYKTTLGWYEKSAQGGNIDAQKSLAKMKFEGEGWFPDQKSAVMWLTKAAEQGDAESKFHLGNIYFNGSSQIEQDYCEAHKWYESLISEDIAADGVSVKTYLGVMYEQGLCVPKDVKKAIELYKDAAELGDASARERLDFLNSPSGLIDDSAAIGIGSDTAAGQLCQQFYPAIKRVFELKQQDTPIEMTLRIIEGSYEYSPRLYQFLSRVAAEIYENPYRQVSFVNSGAYMTECTNFVDGY